MNKLPSIAQMVQRSNDGHRKALARIFRGESLVGPTEPLSAVRGMRTILSTLRRWGCIDANSDVTSRGFGLMEALAAKQVQCPDGGHCWHGCGDHCYRTEHFAPITSYGETWPERPMPPVSRPAASAGNLGLDPAMCRMPDGRWSCTRDHVTEPCGDCDGCRYVYAQRKFAESREAVALRGAK